MAPGAAAVELVRNGAVLDRLERSRPPSVKLVAPGKGTRVRRGGQLQVRWQASDPDGGALQATVDFSPDGGRSWRSVYQGPSTGRATVPSSFLAGSAQARLRVSVNDGFAEATAASSAFTTEGSSPKANIIAPEPGGTVRAGEATLLTGSAADDQMALKGKGLTWFAGRKRLGTGPQIKARLPAGKVTLKLVARDRNGLTGTATLPLRVEARRLRVVSISVPQKVGKSARTVTVTISTSARSTLTAAGRRLRVGTKATKLTIPLPKKPAVGVLRVPFKLSATDRAVKGTVKGAISVRT